jgi:hypothetical protein
MSVYSAEDCELLYEGLLGWDCNILAIAGLAARCGSCALLALGIFKVG